MNRASSYCAIGLLLRDSEYTQDCSYGSMSKIGESKLIDHEIPSWTRIGQAAAMTALPRPECE